jgi:hypothetical protein
VVDDGGRQPQDALLDAVEDGEVELWRGGRDGDPASLGVTLAR